MGAMFPGAASPNIYLNEFEGQSLPARWSVTPRARVKPKPEVDLDTDVAEVEAAIAAVAEAAVAGVEAATDGAYTDSDSEVDGSSAATSIAGDSVASSDCEPETRSARKQPTVPFEGERSRGASSKWNSEPEVGNCGFYFGNWGLRGSVGSSADQKLRTETHDRQIMKNPAQVVILCETTEAVADLLRNPAVAAEKPGVKGLEGRSTYEHYVVRGNEEKSAVLIAARKDNCSYLQLLDYDVNPDHPYRTKGKDKMATTRTLICQVGFKQNVGHIGKDAVVCGVHGHSMTMRCQWPTVLEEFWKRLAAKIKKYGVQIMAGDFNMSITNVIPKLRSYGIQCDCIAWYPWVHKTDKCNGQPLGFDSCAIFYIGGNVQSQLQWSLQHLNTLTAVADTSNKDVFEQFDVYEGKNPPGQTWDCYRTPVAPYVQKDLSARLVDLLTPANQQWELDAIKKRHWNSYCPYLRFKQKPMSKHEWLVNGKMHNGSHMCLCTFTNNSRARSAAKHEEREKRNAEKRGWQQSTHRKEWSDFPKAKIAYDHQQQGGWIDDGTYNDQQQGEWIADGAPGLPLHQDWLWRQEGSCIGK